MYNSSSMNPTLPFPDMFIPADLPWEDCAADTVFPAVYPDADAALPPLAAEEVPAYFRAKIPSYWRRDKEHDYTRRCIYMLTMLKSPDMPALSEVYTPDGNPYHAKVKHFRLGIIINNEISNLSHTCPSVRTFDSVIMPDHVHFVVYLTEAGVYHLGDVVKRFKGLCSRAWERAQGLPEAETPAPVFLYGYHDRYSRSSSHLDTIKKYVRDNPRRLLVKRMYPEYFRMRRRISIDGKRYVMFGNPFLILHPFIGQAIYSSRVSMKDNHDNYEKCLSNIERGGVTIGTFFAHPEKELRDKAIEEGGSLILMHGNGFDERYAPSQPYFDLCMQGRSLIIGEDNYRTSTASDIREHNRAMNALAARIASGEAILQKAPDNCTK